MNLGGVNKFPFPWSKIREPNEALGEGDMQSPRPQCTDNHHEKSANGDFTSWMGAIQAQG